MRETFTEGTVASGRWKRRNHVIVLDLGRGQATEEQEIVGEVPKDFGRRVIHPRIDVDAQRALIAMANRGDPDAEFLLMLVHRGALYGLFKPDQREPAMLIRKFCGNWWEYIAPGARGRLLCHSVGRIMLVFRKNLTREDLIALLKELAAAFRSLNGLPPCASGAGCV
jgi:hypothetical protein